jgi:hypothetical protein
MGENVKVTVEEFKRDPDRYLNEVGNNRSIEVGENVVIVSKADLEGYKATIELLSDWAGGKKVFDSIAEADRLPENLILEKLNAILAWQDVRGKQLDWLEQEFSPKTKPRRQWFRG